MNNYKTLVQGVENAAALYSEHKALVAPNTFYRYDELMREAEKWAFTLLQSTKQTRLHRVAIFSYRNPVGYISTLAAMLTGAAFIPLNPRFPTERNVAILKQSKPDAIIVDSDFIKELVEIGKQMDLPNHILIPDISETSHTSAEMPFIDMKNFDEPESYEFPKINENDIAYILFTSGSTGQPKGVPISHVNVCSFLKYNQNRYQVTPDDRLSQTFEQTFDLSIFDIFMTWCHGASLYVMRPIDLLSPCNYINENKITIWFSVPSIISLLSKQGFLDKDIFPTLRLSLFCGEPLRENEMAAWADAAPNSICENLYGPTELTIACSAYRWEKEKSNISYNGILSIGKLYKHLNYIMVNDSGELTHDEGELCVAGVQRFSGYLNSNDQAKPYFLQVTNNNSQGKIYYRTGDWVKLDTSGNILYLGRIDQQVKINGYRIELGEIESVLTSVNGVEQAIAFCLTNHDQQIKLVSYVVGNVSVDDILSHAKKLLPGYMIPSHVKVGRSLPLNFNGKVDRKFIAAQFIQENLALV